MQVHTYPEIKYNAEYNVIEMALRSDLSHMRALY